MRNFFERRMFWITLLFLLLAMFTPIYVGVGSWDLNRKIGWGWDVPGFIQWVFSSFRWLLLIFTVGYGIILATGRRTDFYLSLLHFELMLLCFVPLFNFNLSIVYSILLVLVFGLNLMRSFKVSVG